MMRIGRPRTWRAYFWNLALLTMLALSEGVVTFAQQPPASPPDDQQPPRLFEEVVVTASARPEPMAQTGSTMQVFDRAAIEASPSTSVTGLLAEYGLAYFSQWSPSQTSINLRGGATDGQGRDFRSQVIVLINGRRAGTANVSKLSLHDVDRIEIVRGPGSLLYGSQALGGVINLITRSGVRGASQSLSVDTGSWGAVDAAGQVNGLAGKLDYSVGAHGGRRGDYDAGAGSAEQMLNTAYAQRGGLVALGYSRSSTERLTFTARTDGIYNAGFRGSQWDTDNYDSRYNQSIDAVYTRASARSGASFTGQYYFFRDVDDFRWGTEIVRLANGTPGPGYDHDDNVRRNSGHGVKANGTFAWWKGATLLTGADAEFNQLRSTRDRQPRPGAAATQTAPFDNNADTRTLGVYAEQVQKFAADRLTLRGGARFDYATESVTATPNQPLLAERTADFTSVTYRAGVVARLRPSLAVRGGVATGYRAPTPTELTADFVTVQGGQVLGDPALNPERTVSLDAGALLERGRVSLDVDLFRSRIRDRITAVAVNSNQSRYTNRATSDVTGLEIQARAELGSLGLRSLRFWTALNGVNHFVMRDNDAAARGLNSDRIDRMTQYQGSLHLGVRQERGWSAQVGGVLSGPLWYDTEENLLIPLAEPSRTYIHRKDPFWLWNASGTYPLTRLVRLRASVTNLLNANVHPTFIAVDEQPYLSDPRFSNGGRGNSLPGRALQVGIEIRR